MYNNNNNDDKDDVDKMAFLYCYPIHHCRHHIYSHFAVKQLVCEYFANTFLFHSQKLTYRKMWKR